MRARATLAAVCLAFACAACSDGGGEADPGERHTLIGTVTTKSNLKGAAWLGATPGGSCGADVGYDDIREGAQAVVKDGKGTVLAVGRLGAGAVDNSPLHRCEFGFSVPNLAKAEFYVLAVSHRGEQTYTYQELEQRSWHVALTLGS